MKQLALIIALCVTPLFGSFGFYRAITVQSGQVPTTQTNFPMVVAGTYAYLAVTGSGGNVTSSSGYDIGFYANSDCTTGKLAWETELYTSTTGAVVYHVKVPSISVGTAIYMCYGDAGITTDQSTPTSVWDSNYKFVWHAKDNAASTTVADSTSNANNGTNAANTSTKTVAGKLGSALSFNGTTDFISRADSGANVFGITDKYTMSMWVNSTDYAQDTKMFGGIFNTGAGGSFMLRTWSTTSGVELTNYSPSLTQDLYSTFPYFINSTPYLIHLVYDGANLMFYGQGAVRKSFADTGNLAYAAQPFTVAATSDSAGFFAATYFDEIRLSNINRSADWITAEYNNQSAPASFYSIGSASTPTAPSTFRRVTLLQ